MSRLMVDAVLFDSGGVLIRPVGGRWNPRFDFKKVVARRTPGIPDHLIAAAIDIGNQWLVSAHATASRDDYHRVLLDALGVEPTPELLEELGAPLDPASVVEPYPEVIGVLDELRARGVRLAVVSDASPNLPDLHVGVGLGGYFEAYAISAVLGCNKPDPRMYRHASDALELDPQRCLFVDDTPPLVEAAIKLGYQGCAVLRNGGRLDGLPTVSDLTEILALIP